MGIDSHMVFLLQDSYRPLGIYVWENCLGGRCHSSTNGLPSTHIRPKFRQHVGPGRAFIKEREPGHVGLGPRTSVGV